LCDRTILVEPASRRLFAVIFVAAGSGSSNRAAFAFGRNGGFAVQLEQILKRLLQSLPWLDVTSR
jgi:hypothetical protein